MCIRDRCNDAALYHEHGQWQITGDPTEAALLVVARKAGLDETCLLYTSDAADERYSVDLGGRRIIKKNTKESK